MNKTTGALKLAEEALEDAYRRDEHAAARWIYEQALAAIREALKEPVTISCDCGDIYERNSFGGKFIQQYGCCPNCDAAKPVQEPVATMEVFSGWEDIADVEILYRAAKKLPDGEYKLYAAPVSAEAIRAEALEEAAKLCEQGTGDAIHTETLKLLLQERGRIASVIRGLK